MKVLRCISVNVLAFALSALHVWGQAQGNALPDAMRKYDTVKLGDGIYTFISPESNGAIVTGNSTVVIGDECVLVVDSGHFPSLTLRMIDQIKRLTDLPVRYLVITHWHPDHNSGNGLYRQAFPGLQIISTLSTRDAMETELPKKEVNE